MAFIFYENWNDCILEIFESKKVTEFWIVGDIVDESYILFTNFSGVSTFLNRPNTLEFESLYRSNKPFLLSPSKWVLFVSKYMDYKSLDQIYCLSVFVTYVNQSSENMFFFTPVIDQIQNILQIPKEKIKYVLKHRKTISNAKLNGSLVDISFERHGLPTFVSLVLGDLNTKLYVPEGMDTCEYWSNKQQVQKKFKTR
jgi:hypothetical protein